ISQDTAREKTTGTPSVLDHIDSALSASAPSPNDRKTEEPAMPRLADTPPAETVIEKSAANASLLEENTAQTASGTLKELLSSLPKEQVRSPATRSGATLEDLVIEAIRPMLAEWLNENLSTIVKQLV